VREKKEKKGKRGSREKHKVLGKIIKP
jgi:hypothetical protein